MTGTRTASGNMTTLKTKISTPKWRECQAFYQTVFGMVIAEAWDEPGDRGVILAFENGRQEAFVELYDTDATHDFSGLSLQFRVDDLDHFLESLPDSIAREGPTPRPWGSTYVYLNDPAGVPIVVFEGGL